MKINMKNEYRIVKDGFCGYEVQIKFWWFKIMWLEIGRAGNLGTNTSSSLETAKILIDNHRTYSKPGDTVVYRSSDDDE